MALAALLDKGRELLDKGRELGSELGRGLAGGHKPALLDLDGRQLLLTSLISEGGFAFVHHARDVATGERFAVKRMLAQDRESAALADAELEFLNTLPPHPNIIKIFGSSRRRMDHGRGYEYLLVLELCQRGSLAKHVTPRSGNMPPKLREVRLLQYFLDTCKGVAHLHSQTPPIQHRDLKLENVLCTHRDVCKLCDFGSATSRTLDCATATRQARLEEEDVISRYTTAWNRSPEMIDLHRGQRIDEKVDVWALGCLLYTLAFQKHPFDSQSQLQILNCNWDFPVNSRYSPELHGLIISCLTADPARRPSVFEITERVAVMFGEAMAGELTGNDEGGMGSDEYGLVGDGGAADSAEAGQGGDADSFERKMREAGHSPLSSANQLRESFHDGEVRGVFGTAGTSAAGGAKKRVSPAASAAVADLLGLEQSTPAAGTTLDAGDLAWADFEGSGSRGAGQGDSTACNPREVAAAGEARAGARSEHASAGTFWDQFGDASTNGEAVNVVERARAGSSRGGATSSSSSRPAPPSPQLDPMALGAEVEAMSIMGGGVEDGAGAALAAAEGMGLDGSCASATSSDTKATRPTERNGAKNAESNVEDDAIWEGFVSSLPTDATLPTPLHSLAGGEPSLSAQFASVVPPPPAKPTTPTGAPGAHPPEAQPQGAEAQPSTSSFQIGEIVTVTALQSKPELNGQSATIIGWDASKGRYNVSVHSGSVVIALKPNNLSPASHASFASASTATATTTFPSSSSQTPCKPESSSKGSSLDALNAFSAFSSTSSPRTASSPTISSPPSMGSKSRSELTHETECKPAASVASGPAAEQSRPSATGLKDHLRSLRECFEEGLITEAEFEREKAALLQSSRPS